MWYMHGGWILGSKREVGTDVGKFGKGSRLIREKVGVQVGSTVRYIAIATRSLFLVLPLLAPGVHP
jgi:hypothetical protein